MTSEAIEGAVVLLPGFVSSIVLNAIVVRTPKDHFTKTIKALVFSFITYTLVVGVLGLRPFRDHEIVPSFLLVAAAVATTLPVLLGFFITNDWHMALLRRLRVTTKTARDTAWLDVFLDQKRYVIVNLTGGRRVFGWPMYYSKDPEEGLLYLYDPSWVTEDGKYADLDTHGLFLVERGAIESIEFTNVSESTAREARKEGGIQ